MKKIMLVAMILSMALHTFAQLDPLRRARDRVQKKSNDKINKRVDDRVDSVFSDKEKTAGEKTKNNETTTAGTSKADTTPSSTTSIKAYSKYDFVPGEKVIGFEDFSTGSIGDFPAGWNTTGSGEIVTIEGKPGRWLWITKPGVFLPELTTKYPDDFTFEFDLLHGVPFAGAQLNLVMAELGKVDQPQHWTLAGNRVTTGLYTSDSRQNSGTVTSVIRKNGENETSNQIRSELLNDRNNPLHVSVWRQKERVRVYLNQEKVLDIPKALSPTSKLNAILFSVQYADETVKYYISNVRLAVGAPDVRNKFLTQKKWVTHGILFDVNSANIKPESYGTLKEMANVMKETADLKVKIVGHTDGDGNDPSNLDLSKRRAASVKDALAKEFGIDESRMQTDGKGESEPIDKNDSPAGKANNRRVEFIKL